MGQTGILLLLILFMGGMLFMSSRQRKKQAAQAEELQRSINVGDVVRMTSGISGTVVDTSDEETLDIEIAQDVITTWLRAAVREKLTGESEHDGSGESTGTTDVTDAPSTTPSVTPGAPSSASSEIAGSSQNGSEPSGEVSSPRTP